MLNEVQLVQVRTFFREFTCSPLYDTGFGDTVVAGGAQTAMSDADLIQSACYIQGAANMARLVQPFGTPQGRICHTMALLAGTLRCYASQVDAVTDATLDDLLARYRRELAELVKEKLES